MKKIYKVCKNQFCRKLFVPSGYNQRFCSTECREFRYIDIVRETDLPLPKPKLKHNNFKESKQEFKEKEQPCFDCQRAVCRCPWSINFTPIKGWVAEKVMRNSGDYGYKILYCPLFIRDEPRYDKHGRLLN